jgi:hypothetical protein
VGALGSAGDDPRRPDMCAQWPSTGAAEARHPGGMGVGKEGREVLCYQRTRDREREMGEHMQRVQDGEWRGITTVGGPRDERGERWEETSVTGEVHITGGSKQHDRKRRDGV